MTSPSAFARTYGEGGCAPAALTRVTGPAGLRPQAPTGLDQRRSSHGAVTGPYGLGCTCDVWAPCSECARREQIEEAQMTRAFVQSTVILENVRGNKAA